MSTEEITFDGIEVKGPARGELVCPVINIWYDLRDRTAAPEDGKPVVDRVGHGDRGVLLERQGKTCRVHTEGGTKGEVKYWFISELRDGAS